MANDDSSWPYDTAPDGLRPGLKFFRFRGASTTNELYSEGPVSQYKAYRLVPYAKNLGLLEEVGDGKMNLTARGRDFLNSKDPRDVLKDSLEDFSLYSELFESLKKRAIKEDKRFFERSEIADEIQDMDGLADQTAKRAATTFAKTMEAAGRGSFRSSKGSEPSGFKFSRKVVAGSDKGTHREPSQKDMISDDGEYKIIKIPKENVSLKDWEKVKEVVEKRAR